MKSPHFAKVRILQQEMALHSSILAWRVPMDKGALGAAAHGVTKSQTRLSASHSHTHSHTHGLFNFNLDLNGWKNLYYVEKKLHSVVSIFRLNSV